MEVKEACMYWKNNNTDEILESVITPWLTFFLFQDELLCGVLALLPC